MNLNEVFFTEQSGFPILSLLILLPLGVLLALRFARGERSAYGIALIGAALEVALTGLLLILFEPNVADVQFVEKVGPLPGLGLSYFLGVDGISVLFLPLTAILTLLVVVHAEYGVETGERRYLMAVFGLQAATMGIFVSLDLVLFWVFFLAEVVPSYVLINGWGTGPLRLRAAREYVTFMIAGSAAMLAGIVLLGVNHLGATGSLSFDLLELLRTPVPIGLQTVAFFLLFVGFAVKAPVFPLHTWMPKVLEHGPVVGVSVFLVGVKVGTYGILRFVIPLLPEASRQWFPLVVVLGALGIFYGGMLALVQTNLRRLLAYGSLSHMGVVLISLFSLNFDGFRGGLLQMVNLGIAGAGLYFMASFLYARVGAPELSSLGGLAGYVPLLAGTFLVIALAAVGMPGTNGFNGEHLVALGALERSPVVGVIVALATLVTGAYLIFYFLRAFMGSKVAPGAHKMPDLKAREQVIALVMAAMIFTLGLYTTPFLSAMDGSLRALSEHVGEPVPAEEVAP